jgi:hypothetical protein
MRRLAAALVGLTVIISTATSAKAEIITFDPFPSTTSGTLGQQFVQGDFTIQTFWTDLTGSPSGNHIGGHFHVFNAGGVGNSGNSENQHFNDFDELQGLVITRTDNAAFSLQSLRTLVQGTTSINGYAPTDVKLLLATSFNPTQSVSSQFTAVSLGLPSGIWSPQAISGFGNVTQIFISSSATVSFDDINLGAPVGEVPEPASIALLGTGALGLVTWKRRRTTQNA